jgi:hypothetical protein
LEAAYLDSVVLRGPIAAALDRAPLNQRLCLVLRRDRIHSIDKFIMRD